MSRRRYDWFFQIPSAKLHVPFQGLDTARQAWLMPAGVAVASMTGAVVFTHLLWRLVQYTPFILGFVAATVSSRVGGRRAGVLAVFIGVLGFAWFPPPSLEARFGALVGFAVISGAFSWLVARRYEIESDLRTSQTMARRSEHRLQAIIDAEPACVTLVSRDGLVLDVNRAGLQMVRAEALSQLRGKPVVDLVHPDDRRRYLETHRAALDGSLGRLEVRLIGLKGDERHVDSCSVPFEVSTEDSGLQRAVLSVINDITERKQLEAQLWGAQQLEVVGRLAGGIAHDFNNVLTAISGFTESVLQTFDETDGRRADLREVLRGAERAASLTRQLLAFSRRQLLQPKVLDLNALAADIRQLLRRTIGDDIDLVLALDPALDPIRADPSQLEQVVLNLAVNARDAMPNGGQLRFVTEMVDVDQSAAERRAPMVPGRYVRLTVADTGIGMSPEIQQHVFEPFFTTKDRNKGTGLGLATVYGIVKQSGGFVWMTSELGRGTSFEIYLPPVHEPVDELVPVKPLPSVTGGAETILVAEDDDAVRRLACTALRRYGYTVLEAHDGDQALRLARSDRQREIQLLITDVAMPGLSGPELAAQLAAERPKMRVLYASGNAESVTMRSHTDQGVLVLAKPFLPADLVRLARQRLDSPAPPTGEAPVRVRTSLTGRPASDLGNLQGRGQ